MRLLKQVQTVIVCLTVSTSIFGVPVTRASTAAPGAQNQAATQALPATSSAPTAKEFQQLVAPIALYPDALVAQVLAGATYPTQVVEADRWVQQNQSLKGEQLDAEVDKQPWDDSIKGLTQFPSVLHKMSENLSWTSALGDAFFNDPDGVMSAIQTLRADAKNAGNLNSNPQQTVSTEGQTIIIQPADPQVVYVPEYSPAAVYGTPIDPYPGYSGWGVAAASALSFGTGIALGAATGGWGWGHWGADWHGGNVNFNRNTYVSRSNTFANRNSRYAQANRGNYSARNFSGRNQAGQLNRPATGAVNRSAGIGSPGRSQLAQGSASRERLNSATSRGFGDGGRVSQGARDNAFGGVRQGGSARMDSSRGRSSFSGGSRGGGGFGGGGGGRGGGGRGGGGRGGGRR